jgi:hypothetical protein
VSATPTYILATGRIVNDWGLAFNSAAPPPMSPTCTDSGEHVL